MDTPRERLQVYLDFKRLGLNEFAKMCEVNPSSLSRVKQSLSKAVLRKIENHSDLNTDWLIKGEGEMLRPSSVHQESRGDDSPNIMGNENEVNSASAFSRFMDELSAQRTLTEKAIESSSANLKLSMEAMKKRDDQIDRLIALLERSIPAPAVI